MLATEAECLTLLQDRMMQVVQNLTKEKEKRAGECSCGWVEDLEQQESMNSVSKKFDEVLNLS